MKGQQWRQSAGTAFSRFSSSAVMAGFVAALYILHSLLPDHDPNINTLDHFCCRFAFLLDAWCSYTYLYLLTCTNKQNIVWLWDYSVFLMSVNFCSPTSFGCYYVWLQRCVCTHQPYMLRLSAHDPQLFLATLPSIMCPFWSFANECLFKTLVIRLWPR